MSNIQNVAIVHMGAAVADDPGGPSIFAAVQQQLGLKLEPARALRDYLFIDSVSRPSPN